MRSSINQLWRLRFSRFFIVGGLGFAVDAGILLLLLSVGLGPLVGRIFSAFLAILTTWLCNRSFTFQVDRPARLSEGGKYFSVMILGLLLNYGIYSLFILAFSFSPFFALVFASALAMLFNYSAASKLVFSHRSAEKS
jgi:putative flippase GtrA